MAYTNKNPTLVVGNILHYGSCMGAVRLKVPCGVSKFIVHANFDDAFNFNYGVKTNYNGQGNFRPNQVITLLTNYGEVPNELCFNFYKSTVVTLELLEINGKPTSSYYENINKIMYTLPTGEVAMYYDYDDGYVGDDLLFEVDNTYLSYLWQKSTDGINWTPATQNQSYQCSIQITEQFVDGTLIRCLVTDDYEQTRSTKQVAIHVLTE